LQVQKPCQHEAGGSCSNNSNLRAHRIPVVQIRRP
jgi:hypothetical protein